MTDIRTGIGFDQHRLVEGPPLLIGGVEIPCEHGPDAHSDGDVLLHAASDACLGAAALGDIGEHFPDTDPEYRDWPGEEMIDEVLSMLRKSGWTLSQMDSVVLLESPKLGGHKDRIQSHLADLTDLPEGRIGVKAKSMEGLGPIGNEQAVAAWVQVLLELASSPE